MSLNELDRKVALKIHKATHSKRIVLRFYRYLATSDGKGAINDKKGKQYRIKDIVKLSAGPRGKLIPTLYDIYEQTISTMPKKAKGTGVGKRENLSGFHRNPR